MSVLTKLLTVFAVFAVVGVSGVIGNAVGMPIGQTAVLGLLLTGVMIVALMRVYGDGSHDSPVAIAAYVMLLFAALFAIPAAKDIWPTVNAFLLFAGTVAAEVAAVQLVSAVLTAVSQGVVRSRRNRERRDLASGSGWRFEPGDADLPSALGGTDHFVAHLPNRLFTLGQRPVADRARAHAVVRGEAGGVEFVVFDFFVPGQRPRVVTTAWLVRLPHALPLFTSAEMFRDAFEAQRDTLVGLVVANVSPAGRDDAVTTTHPDYAHAVMTGDVVTFTREHLASWWVDGTVLASTARSDHGARADLVLRNVEAITWLATVLGSPDVARFGSRELQSVHDRPPAT